MSAGQFKNRKPDGSLKDGLYRVQSERYRFCAGFVVKGGRVIMCAPILRRQFFYWVTLAEWIAP